MCQGSTLRVNLWPQASKNSPKQLRASKKKTQLVLQGQLTFGNILVKKFPLRKPQIVFEITEDKIYIDKCCGESYAMFFLLMLKKKYRASKYSAGPVDARCYWSYRASIILS